MIVFPNAKINLGLRVLRKRADGFHDIETVFFPVPLYDMIEVVDPGPVSSATAGSSSLVNATFMTESGRSLRFSCSGLPVEGDLSKNLCIKACMLFDKLIGLPFNVAMHLHKVIPMGAGLGGGSSDASFVLKALNKLTRSDLKMERLLEMAAALGSDCPFFMINKPVVAQGRGELMSPLTLSLDEYTLVIVKPPKHISTKTAFENIIPSDPGKSVGSVVSGSMKSWKTDLINDFEHSIFKNYPELANIKNLLYAHGAVYASMTGSGSAIYALFEEGPVPNQELFKGSHYFAFKLNH